jgi:hypothetical protein
VTVWDKLDPNQLLPSAVVSGAENLAGALAGLTSLIKSLPPIPSLPSGPDPRAVAATVANAVLDAITDILSGGRVHVLVVPITKVVPRRPPPTLPPTLLDLQTFLDITLGPEDTAAADAYADMLDKTGGNAGFYNAFAESLLDPLDENRPQYNAASDAVAMAVMLVGAPSFSSVMSAASMFDQMTRVTGGDGAGARVIPTPQALTARMVGNGAGVGVRLDWDLPKNTYASPYFPGVSIKVSRYAVIRSTDARAQGARTVLDLFTTQALTKGMTSGKSVVVAIGGGEESAFFDEEVPEEPTYYCVVWETTVTEANGTSSKLPFDLLSNVVKVEVSAPVPHGTGRTPNWHATKAAIEAFPPLSRALQQLIEETRVLVKPTGTSTSRLSDAIQLGTGAATRVAARATELLEDMQRLATSLSRPMPAVYVTQMSNATGGNAFLLAELAKRLGDKTDASRPPFDDSEYVCGVCLVAGAPRFADIAKTIAFFETLLGPADPDNPLLGLIASIDTLVTEAETQVFGPDMRPLPPGSVVDPVTGQTPVPSRPTIAADGTPVATDDPNNPNAGDTNVTPVSDLC